PRPRPPAITTRAAPSSGRVLVLIFSDTNVVFRSPGTKSSGCIVTAASTEGAGSNADVRTVTTLTGSLERTVANALPAYTWRSNVARSTTVTISEIWATSSLAATRGKKSLPLVLAAASSTP